MIEYFTQPETMYFLENIIASSNRAGIVGPLLSKSNVFVVSKSLMSLVDVDGAAVLVDGGG